MNKTAHVLWIGLGLLIAACGQNMSKSATDQEMAAAETTLSDRQFGESIEADGAISYDDLLAQMEHSDSVKVKVKGKVEAVCQAKGCWMNISADRADAENMMVKFKDYGFFVPKDIAGQEVIMQGKAYREVTPVDELRHLAQDAGKSEEEIEKITEPKVELKFMATGVLLVDGE
jgi:hypothetical protein